ncbi:bifunctional diaminohydroxyphosphoribosylaminopyrimidine deaminase/5-amino-6-(5-phosphoribosylamino)uracil reductase RibD [Georgenia deserti]|uniref:Riboflavin biosynthesis protein RibD n=1 Tax=Georgenia deserti TaxID=2093781 RepID=A0ABW4L5N6_9MICO
MTTTVTTRADALTAAMDHAVTLAERGGSAGGNPRVGCVIVDAAGSARATGFHRGAGSPHAEIAALRSLPRLSPAELAETTMVVTLEPCRHHGRTPPCTEAIRAAGIARVVYAVADPNEAAAGGADALRSAGVEVLTADQAGVSPAARARAEELTHAWRTAVRRARPWLAAKTASSLDGRVAAPDGTSRWITGPEARAHAHTVRAGVDAVVVGTGTVLADDPALTARTGQGPRPSQPLRVVIGERDVPPGAQLRRQPGPWRHLRTRDISAALDVLYADGARRVLLDGGPTLIAAALRSGLVDELHTYLAPALIGAGRSAVTDLGVTTLAEAPRFRTVSTTRLGEDILVIARPTTPTSEGAS